MPHNTVPLTRLEYVVPASPIRWSCSGGRFVRLWRNGISHYSEAQLRAKLLRALGSDKLETVWPIKKKVVLSILIINYPAYLPFVVKRFACNKLWEKLKIHNCWPRDARAFGHTPVHIRGFTTIILKMGLRHIHHEGTSRFNVDDDEDRDDDNGDHNCDLDHFNADKSADTIASPCLIVTWD
ncbi:uncharacterized protein LOC120678343 [Panicum virgatum]|uniref:Uncharacterized protein n=1 Tax=Panicum virgatum TaxID=38727 RepID=A0A8T0R4I7_PANVG|nr:uncharacterized protein LOC120678343 [Panicum virgatum]KAG2579883.1 hypothetical protein PVAP13_6NG312500 [Panicum virgatum]